MPKRYPLNEKINALNALKQLNGDRRQAASQLNIPRKTLAKWAANEDQIRTKFNNQQDQHFDQLIAQVHLKLLERANNILDQLDDNALKDASAAQLAFALNTTLTHTIKLQELANQIDQKSAANNQKQPTRLNYRGLPRPHAPAPQPNENPRTPRPLQNRRLRTPMGQNRTRQNGHPTTRH